MSIDKLMAATTENYFYLEKFRAGFQAALKYVYGEVYEQKMDFSAIAE